MILFVDLWIYNQEVAEKPTGPFINKIEYLTEQGQTILSRLERDKKKHHNDYLHYLSDDDTKHHKRSIQITSNSTHKLINVRPLTSSLIKKPRSEVKKVRAHKTDVGIISKNDSGILHQSIKTNSRHGIWL